MAKRLNKFHSDEIRAKIQTSQLINRLHNNAMGKLELSSTQQRSIEILLKKALADLQAISIDGVLDHNVKAALQWLPTQS